MTTFTNNMGFDTPGDAANIAAQMSNTIPNYVAAGYPQWFQDLAESQALFNDRDGAFRVGNDLSAAQMEELINSGLSLGSIRDHNGETHLDSPIFGQRRIFGVRGPAENRPGADPRDGDYQEFGPVSDSRFTLNMNNFGDMGNLSRSFLDMTVDEEGNLRGNSLSHSDPQDHVRSRNTAVGLIGLMAGAGAAYGSGGATAAGGGELGTAMAGQTGTAATGGGNVVMQGGLSANAGGNTGITAAANSSPSLAAPVGTSTATNGLATTAGGGALLGGGSALANAPENSNGLANSIAGGAANGAVQNSGNDGGSGFDWSDPSTWLGGMGDALSGGGMGNLLDLLAANYQYQANQRSRENTERLFAPFREASQDFTGRLQQSYDDPTSFIEGPEFQAIQNTMYNQLSRADAAGGRNANSIGRQAKLQELAYGQLAQHRQGLSNSAVGIGGIATNAQSVNSIYNGGNAAAPLISSLSGMWGGGGDN